MSKSIRFWACGGTGIDLLKYYRESSGLNDVRIHAEELDTYIDTSDANMVGVDKDVVYRVKNIDGGGKDREVVKRVIQPLLPEILLKYPAGDLNVVLFSTSGGTGSAIGPMVLGHLIKGGHTAVAVVISDGTSSKAVANSINTMSDLESISKQLGKAVVVHYDKNDPSKSILDNDQLSKFVMGALSILGSGKNVRMDSADITNFINYDNVTHHKTGLAQLVVTTKSDDLHGLKPLASFAALLGSELSPIPSLEVDYDAVGYMPSDDGEGFEQEFFFGISPSMNSIVDELLEVRDQLIMKKKVNHQTSSLLADDDKKGFDNNSGISLF